MHVLHIMWCKQFITHIILAATLRSVAPWITVLSQHSIHKEGDILQIYFCVIFHERRHHAQAHITSGAICALSVAAKRAQMAAQSSSLASVCYGDYC
jgi:hypothetical protein